MAEPTELIVVSRGIIETIVEIAFKLGAKVARDYPDRHDREAFYLASAKTLAVETARREGQIIDEITDKSK
jgi:hypothetical protein